MGYLVPSLSDLLVLRGHFKLKHMGLYLSQDRKLCIFATIGFQRITSKNVARHPNLAIVGFLLRGSIGG